jgi:hypothetical protein
MHKLTPYKRLPFLLIEKSRKYRLRGRVIFAHALRLIHPCLKLFLSARFHFVSCCAVSFRSEILRTHAD